MIKALIKNRLNSVFGSIMGKQRDGTVKKASAGKIIALSLLFFFAVGSFAFMFVAMAIAFGTVLIPVEASWLYFSVFMIIAFSVVFVLSIFETKSELFECKDNDLLLSMPIKPRDIVISRISVVLIYNLVETMLIMLPCIVVYGIISKDILGVLGSILVSLVIPILATALSSAAGYGVALLSKKLKRNSFVTVAISILLLGAYFIGYEVIASNMKDFLNETAESGIVSEMPILYYIGSAALLEPVSILVLLVLTGAVAYLAYTAISRSYIRLVTDTVGVKQSVYKNEQIKARSALSALVRREIKAFSSSATYMLNSALGLIFMLIVGVVLLFNTPLIMQFADLLYTAFYVDTAMAAVPAMISILIILTSFNIMSSCVLSLEGKNLWIIKTMPISDKDVILSKLLPHIIITTPPTLVCSVLFIIAISAPIETWALFLITPIIANAFFAAMGLCLNVLFPRFDFENEAQAIKQSMSVMLALLLQMLVSAIIGAGSLFLVFIMNPLAVSILMAVLYAVLFLVMCLLLFGPVKRRYARIDV